MRHIRVFAQPVGRFHTVFLGSIGKHTASRFHLCGLRILNPFRIKLFAVLIIRLLLIVHEEVDTGSEEVHGRSLEELVRTATTFLFAFLQGLNQGLSRFLCCCQIVDVLLLDRIHATRILHVHEVDDVERTVLRNPVQCLVLLVVVVELGGQCRKLIVIDHHSKALCRMLFDERLDDGECLT